MDAEKNAKCVEHFDSLLHAFEELHAEDPTAVIRVQWEFSEGHCCEATNSESFNELAAFAAIVLQSCGLIPSWETGSRIALFVQFVRETLPFERVALPAELPASPGGDDPSVKRVDCLPPGSFLHAALAVGIARTKFETAYAADQCRLSRLLAQLPSKFEGTIRLLWDKGYLIFWEITAVRSVWPIGDCPDPHKAVKAFLRDLAAHLARDASESGVSLDLIENGVRLNK
jgi:hypothetical protein